MPGPMSLPSGNHAFEWTYEELSDVVCNYHFNCDMRQFNKDGDEVKHDYITFREWLARRGRLRTGKTV